jgi:hypothetical protein
VFCVVVALSCGLAAVPGPAPGAEAAPAGPAAPAQAPGTPTVRLYGKSGTFGQLDGLPSLASGQSLATNAVPGWTFPGGREFWANARTADGSIIVAGGDQMACQACQTSAETAISAFNPSTNSYAVTKLRTTMFNGSGQPIPGVEAPPTPGMVSNTVGDGPEQRGGTSVSDLAAFNGGNAVAFVAWADHLDHDVNQYGIWPAFGILTKVSGTWQVASGSGWMNQWTGKELRTSRPDSNVDEAACPEDIRVSTTGLPPSQTVAHFPGHSACGSLNEIEALPPTGIPNTYDFVVTQYGDDDDNPQPATRGGVAVLRVTGPDAQGRYTTQVRGKFTYPSIPDPNTPAAGDHIGVSVMGATVDPTGAATPTDMRFTVNFDMWQAFGAPVQPTLFQEMSYNATTGAITPVSAPLLPGDVDASCGQPYGFKHVAYAADGTMYATRFGCGFMGGKLAVFPKVGGQRRISGNAACAYDPGVGLANHTSVIAGRTVWGEICRPNHDILQPQDLPFAIPVENPATHDIVLTTLHGQVLPIRPSGSGDAMSFQVGNTVDLSHELLGRTNPASSLLFSSGAFGSFDPDNRLWLSVGESRGGEAFTVLDATGAPRQRKCESVTYPRYLVDDPATGYVPADDNDRNEGAICMVRDALPSNNWLYSVDIDDLFDPPAVPLPTVVNAAAGIHAEMSTTQTSTWTVGAAPAADKQFTPDRYIRRCGGTEPGSCAVDLGVGDGFFIDDLAGWGHGTGEAAYKVSVAATGCYRLGYFVATWGSQTGATITAQVGSSSVSTNVHSSSGVFPFWAFKQSSTNLCFTSTGTHTVRLTGSGGAWYLNWFSLQRV